MSRFGPKPLPRVPLAPLTRLANESHSGLARRLGVSRPNVCRASREGLTINLADRWAIALDLHPVTVWGDAWLEACDGVLAVAS